MHADLTFLPMALTLPEISPSILPPRPRPNGMHGKSRASLCRAPSTDKKNEDDSQMRSRSEPTLGATGQAGSWGR